jgi:hypothetical protein
VLCEWLQKNRTYRKKKRASAQRAANSLTTSHHTPHQPTRRLAPSCPRSPAVTEPANALGGGSGGGADVLVVVLMWWWWWC